MREDVTNYMYGEEVAQSIASINGYDIGQLGFKKQDLAKVDWSLMPMKTLEEVVQVLMYGANKYSRDNWKKATSKEDIERIYAACQRHLADYQVGIETDTETNLRHLAHATCNLIFLLYLTKGQTNEQVCTSASGI